MKILPVGKEHKDSMLLDGRRAAFSAKKQSYQQTVYFKSVRINLVDSTLSFHMIVFCFVILVCTIDWSWWTFTGYPRCSDEHAPIPAQFSLRVHGSSQVEDWLPLLWFPRKFSPNSQTETFESRTVLTVIKNKADHGDWTWICHTCCLKCLWQCGTAWQCSYLADCSPADVLDEPDGLDLKSEPELLPGSSVSLAHTDRW